MDSFTEYVLKKEGGGLSVLYITNISREIGGGGLITGRCSYDELHYEKHHANQMLNIQQVK